MKKVLLLLCKGVEIFEAAAFYDVMGWSSEYGSEKVEIVPVGLTGEVTCTFGWQVRPQAVLDEVDLNDFDGLAVPGGFGTHGFYEEAYSQQVAELIRYFEAHDKPIAAICVGALSLANSGILKNRKATTYHLRGGLRRQQLAEFGVEVVDAMVVRDGKITTSTSPASAVEVALALLADLTGDENSTVIRELMGFGRKPV